MVKKLSFMGGVIMAAFLITWYGVLAVPNIPGVAMSALITSVEAPNDLKSLPVDRLALSCLPPPKQDPYAPPFPNFGRELCSEIPLDAYNSANFPNLKPQPVSGASTENPSNLAKRVSLQRKYDIFSWQSFLAINWPVESNGTTREHITELGEPSLSTANICRDNGTTTGTGSDQDLYYPRWTIWKEVYEVFEADGSAPSSWGSPRTTLPATTPPLTPIPAITSNKDLRILYIIDQANSELPLWDQHGNTVYYEILLNEELFNDIITNTLYNVQGQLKFYAENEQFGGADFAYGKINQQQLGDIAVKLAWKIIDKEKGDIPERFYTMSACVLDHERNEWMARQVGLVGMHIAHKTLSSQKWVWSTFEHVDNVRVDGMTALAYANTELLLEPSFNDPYCETCAVNVEPELQGGIRKTQVTRVIPISRATEELNRQVQERLKTAELLFDEQPHAVEALDSGAIPEELRKALETYGLSEMPIVFVEEPGHKWQIEDRAGRYAIRLVDDQLKIYRSSVWQYYELIGTQYALDSTQEPPPDGQGPGRITNRSGGYPQPAFLVNSVIETYDQVGNQEAGNPIGGVSNASRQVIFATQSCMGCHYNSGLAVASANNKAFRLPGTGDFSFVLERAEFKK